MQLHKDWESRAQLLHSLAHPGRLTVLEALCEGPLCVNDFNSMAAMPPTTSFATSSSSSQVRCCHLPCRWSSPLLLHYQTDVGREAY